MKIQKQAQKYQRNVNFFKKRSGKVEIRPKSTKMYKDRHFIMKKDTV